MIFGYSLIYWNASCLIFLKNCYQPITFFLLTLFTLHSSVVAWFLETDVSQVQDSSHNLKHHGTVLRWDANHLHGMLGKQRKRSCEIRGRSVGLLTPAVPSSCPLITPVAVLTGKQKQEEIVGKENKRVLVGRERNVKGRFRTARLAQHWHETLATQLKEWN